jgi:signal transduction histidine kinase
MPVRKEKSFVELESLSVSINTMMEQIRSQMGELQKELERKTLVEEQRRQFVNNVSHEMKTPLAIISGQVEMLGFIEDEQKRQEYCESIVEETQKMTHMINDMIASYKSDPGADSIKMKSVDIGAAVHIACNKCSRLFEQNNIELIIEEQCNANVLADEHMIIQAVDNYLTNAVKHSTEGSIVHVRIIDDEDMVRIEVENSGPNIPDEDKDKIWDSFYTGDTTETLNGQKGSGLGLAIVKNIMTIHHGEYGFDNLPKGIVFWISFEKQIAENS